MTKNTKSDCFNAESVKAKKINPEFNQAYFQNINSVDADPVNKILPTLDLNIIKIALTRKYPFIADQVNISSNISDLTDCIYKVMQYAQRILAWWNILRLTLDKNFDIFEPVMMSLKEQFYWDYSLVEMLNKINHKDDFELVIDEIMTNWTNNFYMNAQDLYDEYCNMKHRDYLTNVKWSA